VDESGEKESSEWRKKLFWTGLTIFNIGIWYNPTVKIIRTAATLDYPKYFTLFAEYILNLHFSYVIACIGLLITAFTTVLRVFAEGKNN